MAPCGVGSCTQEQTHVCFYYPKCNSTNFNHRRFMYHMNKSHCDPFTLKQGGEGLFFPSFFSVWHRTSRTFHHFELSQQRPFVEAHLPCLPIDLFLQGRCFQTCQGGSPQDWQQPPSHVLSPLCHPNGSYRPRGRSRTDSWWSSHSDSALTSSSPQTSHKTCHKTCRHHPSPPPGRSKLFSFLGKGNPPPGHGDNDGNDDDDDDILLFLPKSGLSHPKTTASFPNPALVVAAVGQGKSPPPRRVLPPARGCHCLGWTLNLLIVFHVEVTFFLDPAFYWSFFFGKTLTAGKISLSHPTWSICVAIHSVANASGSGGASWWASSPFVLHIPHLMFACGEWEADVWFVASLFKIVSSTARILSWTRSSSVKCSPCSEEGIWIGVRMVSRAGKVAWSRHEKFCTFSQWLT